MSARLRIARLAFVAAVLVAPWLFANVLPGWLPGITRRPVPQRDLLPPGALVSMEGTVRPFESSRLRAEIPGMTAMQAAAFYESTPPRRGWTVTKPAEERVDYAGQHVDYVVSKGRDETYLVSFSYRRSLSYVHNQRTVARLRAAERAHARPWKGDIIEADPQVVEPEGPAGTEVQISGNARAWQANVAVAGAPLLYGLAVVLGVMLFAPRRAGPGAPASARRALS